VDNLRGIAILGVLAVHSIYATNRIAGTSDFNFFTYTIALGKYGVEVFFFISGLLMVTLYGTRSKLATNRYFIKRFFRVYPLWFAFTVLSFLAWKFSRYGGVYEALESTSFSPWVVLLASLTFTLFFSTHLWNTVIPGGWSIQVEVFHYIAFAFLRRWSIGNMLILLGSLNFGTSVIAIIVSWAGVQESLIFDLLNSWLRLGLYSSVSFFVLGGILGSFSQSNQLNFLEVLKLKKSTYFRQGIYFGLSLILIPTPLGKTLEALGFLCLALFIGWASLQSGLATRVLGLLGKYSYFIYFCHFLILDLLVFLAQHSELNFDFPFAQKVLFIPIFLVTSLCSIFLGSISMKYFEMPLIRLGNRFRTETS
jgi:peptidoglycan/LPS O-acetylase OafA/YrhL